MIHHTVAPGDTLTSIARRHGSTVAAIERANAWIDNIHQVKPGWVLHVPTVTAPPPDPPPAAEQDGIWIDHADLMALPTSGPAWQAVVAAATRTWPTPDVSDQDQNTDVYVFAGALHAVRTNDLNARQRVADACRAAVGTEAGGRTLALGRNLTGYVLAADLIGYRDDSFVAWVDEVRDRRLDGRANISTLRESALNDPSNWGSHARTAFLAASLYVDDTDAVDELAERFHDWTGRSSEWRWVHDSDLWQPSGDWRAVLPDGATIDGHDVSGALPEEMRRAGTFRHPFPHENYAWEALQGALTTATILARHGHPDVWDWSDRALRRAFGFLASAAGFPPTGDDRFIVPLLNAAYRLRLPVTSPVSHGKSIGYTDWTHPTR